MLGNSMHLANALAIVCTAGALMRDFFTRMQRACEWRFPFLATIDR